MIDTRSVNLERMLSLPSGAVEITDDPDVKPVYETINGVKRIKHYDVTWRFLVVPMYHFIGMAPVEMHGYCDFGRRQ